MPSRTAAARLPSETPAKPPERTIVPAALQPDFNPIEKAFSKLNAHLPEAAERTIHGLWNAIGRILALHAPQACAKCFAPCGYDAT